MALQSPDGEITDEQLQLLELVRVNHDEAYLYVSQGISYQEQQQKTLARDMYLKGLDKIDAALNVRCDDPHCVGPKWDSARKLQQKMRKTAQMIQAQLQELTTAPAYQPPEPLEPPPSYEQACEEHALLEPHRSSCPSTSPPRKRGSTEVVELFCIPDEVQLFFVSYDGSVSTSSTDTSLHVYQFVDHASDANRPPAWLQVGSWTYPLIPGQSPALESGYGAFLFPDVGAGRDSAVGLILPPSVDTAKRRSFLELLQSLTALVEEKKTLPASGKTVAGEEEGPASFSESLSKGIVIGAEYISAGLVKGATLSSDLIHRGATKARERINPEEKPVAVNPRVRQGLKIAREASGVALKATGFLVKRLGDLTVALGKHLAPHLRDGGTKLLTTAFRKDSRDAQDTMDGVLTVAAGGLQGFSTLYMGLEQAARTLASSLSSETVNIVDHKYGSEAGEVVGNALFSIGNLALTTHNVQSLGPKSLAKRTAKDAGKAVLRDYVENGNIAKK